MIFINNFYFDPPISSNNSRVLVVGIDTEPMNLNPWTTGEYCSEGIVSHLYEGLFRVGSNGIIEPCIAKKVVTSNCRKKFDIFLKKSFWSDGSLVTAYDFERGWKNSITYKGPLSSLFFVIKNVKEFLSNKVSWEDVGIKVKNDTHIQIILNSHTPYLKEILSLAPFYPMHPNEGKNSYFNGPFKRDSNKNFSNELYIFSNEHYIDKKKVHLDVIKFVFIENERIMFDLIKLGKIDVCRSEEHLPNNFLKDNKLPLNIHIAGQIPETIMIILKQDDPILKNKNIRKAFCLSISKNEIVDNVNQQGHVANRIVPPIISKYNKSIYRKNIAEARKYFRLGLKELGLTKEYLEKNLNLSFSSDQVDKKLTLAIQNQWNQNLDLNIPLKQLDLISSNKNRQDGTFKMSMQSWVADFSDPLSFLESFATNGYYQHCGKIESFEDLLTLAMTTNDEKERLEALIKAEDLLLQECVVIPIFHPSEIFIFNSNLSGINFNSFTSFPIYSFAKWNHNHNNFHI